MNIKENLLVKVSVVMSVYNEEEHVFQAIESILNQTFKNFEFIIINDGSVDGTCQIIKKYAEKDKRIKIINHVQKQGLPKSLNEGIKTACGKYIARMDADDVSLPERLEKQVKFMDEHSEIGALGTCYKEIDESSNTLPRKQNPVERNDIKNALFFYNPIAHPTVMIRKSVLKKIGYYDESFPTSQDYELFSRMAQVCELGNLDEELLIRRFPGKVSGKKMRRQTYDCLRVQLRLLKAGRYPAYYSIFMIKNLGALIIPVVLRETIRRLRHRRYR